MNEENDKTLSRVFSLETMGIMVNLFSSELVMMKLMLSHIKNIN